MKRTLFSLCALFLGCAQEVDLNAVPEAKALCESSTPELRTPTARMLPGRRCLLCHTAEGQADGLNWTAAGTLFNSLNSPCNTGGVEGAKVDLLDETGQVLISLVTNRSGNFFTAEPLRYNSFRARVTWNGKTREMSTLQTQTDCAACHYPGGEAGGRIYIN